VFDRTSAFIGTLNVDPRSLRQNTECGVLIENAEVAARVAELFEVWTGAGLSYRVRLRSGTPGTRLEWISSDGGAEVIFRSEPRAGIVRRMLASIFSLLPIESQV
jgi:putative cardiolipin synthase